MSDVDMIFVCLENHAKLAQISDLFKY